MDQAERAAKIEAAAYAVLHEKGFKGASMLAIAKAAKASNETMYKWYGNKIGLFSAMIRSNTAKVEAVLVDIRAQGATGLGALEKVGPVLLHMVTSENAVALNRAAAGDVTGELGRLLGQQGRERLVPALADLFIELYGPQEDLSDRIECYVALLIGDLQIRRAIHVIAPLSRNETERRSARALERLARIFPFPA